MGGKRFTSADDGNVSWKQSKYHLCSQLSAVQVPSFCYTASVGWKLQCWDDNSRAIGNEWNQSCAVKNIKINLLFVLSVEFVQSFEYTRKLKESPVFSFFI